jgi:HAD superfamily hydrolase (TIGR01509 family)
VEHYKSKKMQLSNPERIIIFDMDGVLFDSEPLHVRFEDILFNKLNINVSESQKRRLVGLGGSERWKMIKESFNLTEPLEKLLLIDREERILFFHENETTIMPGAKVLLERLRLNGFRMALASSSQIEVIDLNLSNAGFDKFFEVKISGDIVSRGKPDPDIFLYAADKMKASPQNCVVIEDSENGINAAKSAGMKCIAFTSRQIFYQDVSNADTAVADLANITPEMILALWH